MRKWFCLYLTFSAGRAGCLLLISLYMVSHMANRTPPNFSGGRACLLYSLGPFLLSQGSNYAERKIKKIAAEEAEGTEGSKGAQADLPWWYRGLDRTMTALTVLALILTVSTLALTWKQYFAS